MLLYVIKFKKGNMIKIGIGKSELRVHLLNRVYRDYELDMDNVYIVTAKSKSTITALERQLLNDYEDFKIDNDDVNFRDGHTELRHCSIYDDVLNDIKYKAEKFISKGIKLNLKKLQKTEKLIKDVDKLKTVDKYSLNKKKMEKEIKEKNLNIYRWQTYFIEYSDKIKNIYINENGSVCVDFVSMKPFIVDRMLKHPSPIVSGYDKTDYRWYCGFCLLPSKNKPAIGSEITLILSIFKEDKNHEDLTNSLTVLVDELLKSVNLVFSYEDYQERIERDDRVYYCNKRLGRRKQQ